MVIHTGGAKHLSNLVREGYVQGLLGGNAIAVHDIEQSLMGTSLGVDMQKGTPVRGGLIKAQAEYAQLLEGTDMILMLSTMLHSIGVGNMTPAGVKMVCVDINPAVVTKLSDRGSVESVGVVTDVGLFLSLLVNQLEKLTSPYQTV